MARPATVEWRVFWILLILVILIVPTNYAVSEALATPAPTQLTPVQEGFMTHVDHIIYVVMENHAFDNLFGTYCQQVSKLCPNAVNGIPAGTCVPLIARDPTGPCVKPFNFTAANWSVGGLMPHDEKATTTAWDNGRMDGFYQAENSGLNPFGHYNGTTVPIYWDLAEEYGLSDEFFSSNLSYSLPNHWHIVAGQAPAQENVTQTNVTRYDPKGVKTIIEDDHQYLNESNQTETIEQLLEAHPSVTWAYYDDGIEPYQKAIGLNESANGTEVTPTGTGYDYWNPLEAKNQSYAAGVDSHFLHQSSYFVAAKDGDLPNVSWVIPTVQDSDHPPYNSTLAQSWLASVVDALEASPDWSTSVMYITFDEYGGFYDHVAPPVFDGMQLSLRVPLFTIGPYALPGHVSHYVGYFESVLHLMEWRFNLGTIGTLDREAPLPLWGLNFSFSPHKPILFPTNFSLAKYPYNPNWNGTANVIPGSFSEPEIFVGQPEIPDPDGD
jgi:phospholipase C